MGDSGSAKTHSDIRRLRLMALIPLGWFVFVSLLPDFVMRVSGYRIPWISGAAAGVGVVLICLFTGYLLIQARSERWMYVLISVAVLLLVISQLFRICQTVGLLDDLALGHWSNEIRALDNLFTGLGLVLIALTYFYLITALLASRQQLQVEHDRLTAEIARRTRTEKSLREREALLQGINTSALDAIIAMDNTGCVTYWNPAAERILGYSAGEIVGRPLHETLAPADQRLESAAGIAAWRDTGQGPVVGRTLTLKAVRKDGATVDVALSVSSVEILGHWYAVGILRDITEQKRLEALLRDREERYRSLFVDSRDAIMTVSPDWGFVAANPATLRLFGLRGEVDFTAHTPASLSPEYQPDGSRSEEKAREMMDLALEHGSHHFEWLHCRADGTEFPATVLLSRFEHGGARLLMATVRDITARKATEAALQESEEKYRLLVENSIEGIGIAKANEVIFANATLLSMLGYETVEELTQVPLLEHVVPEYRDAAGKQLSELAAGHAVAPLSEYDVFRKDGTRKTVQTCSANITIGGEPLIQITLHDVTELKQAEADRRNLEAQVQHRQKLESLGVLTGGIAHDFNNILHLILGNLHHAQKALPVDSPARPFISNIEKSANRAAALTHQMLAYSGKGSVSLEVLDLGETVDEMVHLIRSSVPKKVELKMDLARDLPPIEADSAQIQQVVLNLVLNASEAVDEERGGTVTVSTRALHCDGACLENGRGLFDAEEGDYVCLQVSDTGCGMSEETQARLFDPFFTTKFTGRGLGMSAVLGIVRAHEGTILVESAPEAGTTVRVLIPAAAGPLPTAAERAAEHIMAPRGDGRTILFVDDEPDMLDLGGFTLEQMGYTVLTAADGYQAVEVFKARPGDIDCVILDLSMPRMDGVETLAALRRIDPRVRAILASGYAEQELQARFADLDVGCFMEKPYNYATLAAALGKALG